MNNFRGEPSPFLRDLLGQHACRIKLPPDCFFASGFYLVVPGLSAMCMLCLSDRKILVSVKFVSAILGPEMGAPILWTRGKMRSFCRKTHVHKIPRFRGGGILGFLGGVPILFLWARGFF